MNDTTPTAKPLTIVVVDDHAMMRAGLKRLLDERDDMQLVGTAGTTAEALEVVGIKRPNIVVLDITLGDEDALDALPDLLRKSRDSQILILSMHDDVRRVQSAFASGAHGYLLKHAAEDDLVDAIHTLQRGERYVHPTLGARLAKAAVDGSSDPLTEREREVARLLALGHTNQEIARQIYVSVRTVETHRANIFNKLNLNSRAGLVQWALKEGLLETTG
ncbi:MAG: response regulator [Acidimicrobiales bacterium]